MNKDEMLVSVVVGTFNHKSYIEECLDGILLQKTTFNYEIILGEDESTDGTREVCKIYAAKYPDKIKLILRSQKDVIFINNRPTGRYNFIQNLKAAKGKYIALLDGDDYWIDPLKLQKQIDFLELNTSFAGVFHNVFYVNESTVNTKSKWRQYKKDVFTSEDTITHRSLFHTSSYVFRNKNIEFPNWFNTIASADMALLSIISKNGKLKLLDGEMSVYRKNEGGITTNENKKQYHKNRIKLIKHLTDFFQSEYKAKANDVLRFHENEISNLESKKSKKFTRRILNKINQILGKSN